MNFLEGSLDELFQSAVDAFPNTTKRQHLIPEIQIRNIRYVPYLGLKTLYIRAEAVSNKTYQPIILFKNVNYHRQRQNNLIEIVHNGRNYFLENLENNDVLVKCSCMDFYYRFNYYNNIQDPKSLYGQVRPPYFNQGGPPANPAENPGICKHLMALSQNLF